MSEQSRDSQLPVLEEYHFHSSTPVLGPMIAWARTLAYNVAARWGVQAVITRQNEINAQLVEVIRQLEVRLIEQDRDLTMLARTLAEIDIRQRHLTKALTQQEHDGGS